MKWNELLSNIQPPIIFFTALTAVMIVGILLFKIILLVIDKIL